MRSERIDSCDTSRPVQAGGSARSVRSVAANGFEVPIAPQGASPVGDLRTSDRMKPPEFPKPQKQAIDLVRETAVEKSVRPYLVGGPVRDLLLGRAAFDIDLTIEEDSAVFARALAKRVNGRVKSFPQFLTYKVVAADVPEIDIATARK